MMNVEPIRVLHIDDDPACTRLVAKVLGDHGIEVTQLHDSTRAVDCILNGNFRIAIVDVDMPGLNGIDLLADIKQVDGGTSVIVLTGVVSLTSVLRSMRKGATACLFKPLLSVDALLDCIQEIQRNTNRWWATLRQLSEMKRHDADLVAEFSQATLTTNGSAQ